MFGEYREQSVLFPEDWKTVKVLGAIVLERIHSGMKIFPTSMVATALLQQLQGIQWGKMVFSTCQHVHEPLLSPLSSRRTCETCEVD